MQPTAGQLTRHRRAGAGFSTFELVIMILILGVGMTLALKGTVLIDVAQDFKASYDIQYYQSRMQLYASQFKYLPGDDPKAATRFGHPPAMRNFLGAAVASLGDNRIDGQFLDTESPLGEQFMFWRDLRYARLVEGDPEVEGPAAMPSNPFGGVYGIDEGNLGQGKSSICLNKVPGRALQRLLDSLRDSMGPDAQIGATSQPDVGPAKGHYDHAEPQPYDVDKTYIICAPLQP